MAKLTAKHRNALGASTFALPKSRSFPIPDVEHGRKALQLDTHKSPAARAEISRKVHAKFPGIGKPKHMAEGAADVSPRMSFPLTEGSADVRGSRETRRAGPEHGYCMGSPRV